MTMRRNPTATPRSRSTRAPLLRVLLSCTIFCGRLTLRRGAIAAGLLIAACHRAPSPPLSELAAPTPSSQQVIDAESWRTARTNAPGRPAESVEFTSKVSVMPVGLVGPVVDAFTGWPFAIASDAPAVVAQRETHRGSAGYCVQIHLILAVVGPDGEVREVAHSLRRASSTISRVDAFDPRSGQRLTLSTQERGIAWPEPNPELDRAPPSPWEYVRLGSGVALGLAIVPVELASIPAIGSRFRLDLTGLAAQMNTTTENGTPIEFETLNFELELREP